MRLAAAGVIGVFAFVDILVPAVPANVTPPIIGGPCGAPTLRRPGLPSVTIKAGGQFGVGRTARADEPEGMESPAGSAIRSILVETLTANGLRFLYRAQGTTQLFEEPSGRVRCAPAEPRVLQR